MWLGLSLGVLLAAVAVALLSRGLSGVRLVADASALARVQLQPLAGSLVSVRAQAGDGSAVPLLVSHGRMTPRIGLRPGERVSISVVVRRPGWERWALGADRRETLSVETPRAAPVNRWITVAADSRATVRFDMPVARVSVPAARVAGSTVTLPATTAAGSVSIAAAARPWERLGAPVRITWFPRAARPVVLVSPGPGVRASPGTPIRLTFSKPVSHVLGSSRPALVPALRGRWTRPDDHTLVFRPGRAGLPFDSTLVVRFPVTLLAASTNGVGASLTKNVRVSVAPASLLRLQQLLAQQGYLPLDWTPAARDAGRTMERELAAAVHAPAGRFHWRYADTPHELQTLWTVGKPNAITRAAVMMFEDEHHLAVDGIAGPDVWRALLADAVAGKRRSGGYSYVYVHRDVPQLLTLWHDGRVVLTSPGNTGVPAAPTALGTWPVFEHIPIGTMSGTNPDGSHYHDPGIRWISYFHGGEALHAFTRASYGTPQSLGCVELPLAAAARVWPYTPIGTLVTIEN